VSGAIVSTSMVAADLLKSARSPCAVLPSNAQHVGDALLGGEVTLMIHEKYPQLVIGGRTLVKSALVENVTLSQLATAYKMHDRILAAAEQASILRNNTNVQASIFEAYLGAVHEEAGQAELRQFVRGVFDPLLPPVVETCRSLADQTHSTQEQVTVPRRQKGPVAATGYIGALKEWAEEKGVHGRHVQYEKPTRFGPVLGRIQSVTCIVSPQKGVPHKFKGTAETVAKAKNECVCTRFSSSSPPRTAGIY
jgi:hypothetical protein